MDIKPLDLKLSKEIKSMIETQEFLKLKLQETFLLELRISKENYGKSFNR